MGFWAWSNKLSVLYWWGLTRLSTAANIEAHYFLKHQWHENFSWPTKHAHSKMSRNGVSNILIVLTSFLRYWGFLDIQISIAMMSSCVQIFKFNKKTYFTHIWVNISSIAPGFVICISAKIVNAHTLTLKKSSEHKVLAS